jgi:hypothetical protein
MSPADTAMSEPAVGALLGVGKEAEVFVCGALVVKLYKPTAPKRSPFREAAILAMIESLGLSAPIVHGVQQIGDRWGVLMSRVEGPSFVAPEMASAYVDAYAQVSGKSRAAILDWLPFVAAARLAEGVPEVDDLMKMVDG